MSGRTTLRRIVRGGGLLGPLALVGLLPSVGCFSPESVRCPSGVICPPGFACRSGGGCYRPGPARCGNGIVERELGEVCDDGDTVDGDGCSANCLSDERCGNGVVDESLGEACDDGNTARGDGCNDACRVERCGNGVLDDGEACDDGNNASGDGCRADCLSDERCGNGEVDPAIGEECDDGNLRSRDGCASNCRAEVTAWQPRAPPNISGRYHHAAAFDAVRGWVIVFGGFEAVGASPLGDTWVFDGQTWAELSVAASPSPRQNHAMVYDAARDRVVLFGGRDAAGARGDTWELVGLDWQEVVTTPAPEARYRHAMAYDASRSVTFLTGGTRYDGDASGFADTWSYDAAGWSLVSPTGAPPRRDHVLVAEPSGRVIAFGGWSPGIPIPGTTPSAQTWAFDGTGWQQLSPPASAPPLADAVAVYDTRLAAIVIFGGTRQAGVSFAASSETWRFDGTTWREEQAAVRPAGRDAAAAAFDPTRGEIVVVGGRVVDAADDETWRHGEFGWREVVPAHPRPRYGAGVARDPVRDLTYLFGGVVDEGGVAVQPRITSELWAYDGRFWHRTSVAGTTPGQRAFPALAYDETRRRIVLFGGEEPRGLILPPGAMGGTWEFDGTTWTEMNPPQSPSARTGSAMVWDAGRGALVLFGGAEGSTSAPTPRGDTWSYDGQTWTEIDPGGGAGAPTPRSRHAMVYDRARGRIVLYGGLALSGAGTIEADAATWELDLVGWRRLDPPFRPPNRWGHRMIYEPRRERVLVFGGARDSAAGVRFLDDLWEWDGSVWRRRHSATPQPARRAHAHLFYDFRSGTFVVYGGWGEGYRHLGDVAEYGYWGTSPAEICDVGGDQDLDGQAGCDDPDCNFHPSCPTAVQECLGESDDDGDGLLPAADPNCGGRRCNLFGAYWRAGVCFCPQGTAEACDNGTDDDCNGLVDAADPACQ